VNTDFPVAIVGLGKMGILHAGILSALPGVKVAGACDRSRTVLRFFRRVWPSARLTTNVEDLEGSGFAAAFVTTPIASHCPIGETILARGIARNLFIEKTLASSAREAEAFAHLASRQGARVMVGYQRRFCATFQKAKELVERGEIGRIESFEGYAFSSDLPLARGGPEARRRRGGVLRDLGSHAISLALGLFGDLRVEHCECEPAQDVGGEHTATLTVQEPRGAPGRFRFSWAAVGYRMPEVGMAIRGTEGLLEMNEDTVRIVAEDGHIQTWYRHDLDERVAFLLGGPEYFREDASFVEKVRAGESLDNELQEAVKVDRILEEARSLAGGEA